jgi:hypothetical protein
MAGIGWAPLGGEWWTWQWCFHLLPRRPERLRSCDRRFDRLDHFVAHIRGRVAWQTALAADRQLLPTPVPRPRPAPSSCKTHAEGEIGCRAVRAAWGIPQWTVTTWTVFLRCAEWLAPLISCYLWSTWACRHSPTAGPHSSAAAAATAYGLPPLPRRRRCGRHRRTSALSHGCRPAGGKKRAAGA